MLRSLYSGVSGMKVNQAKMDVIGNNIANVGTTAFKGGRVRFQDMLSQSSKSAMAPMTNTGGVNSSQVGLGVQIAGIDTITTQGMMQSTGGNLDLAVDGDGYFMVSKGPVTLSTANPSIQISSTGATASHTVTSNPSSSISYTRDGSFTLDSDGNLLTSDGYRVMGYSLQSNVPPAAAAVSGLGFTLGTGTQLNGYKITTVAAAGPSAVVNTAAKTITITSPVATTAAALQATLNAALVGQGITQSLTLSGAITAAGGPSTVTSATAVAVAPPAVTLGAVSFTFGAGSALNGYTIVSGNTAAATPDKVTIDANAKTITIDGDVAGVLSTTAILQPLLNTELANNKINQTITLGGGPLAAAITPTGISGGLDGIVHSIDMAGGVPVTNYVDGTVDLKADDSMLKSLKIPDTVTTPNGVLRVKTFSISKEGVISAVLEDGSVSALGQVAMASFRNPAGLTKEGKNLVDQSSNSGVASIRTGVGAAVADDNSKGYGDQVQGMLEMSNVDLAEQFTDMIVTSRAFQASGKMITTGDEMLQDIINLKR